MKFAAPCQALSDSRNAQVIYWLVQAWPRPRVWEASAIKSAVELLYAEIGFADYPAKQYHFTVERQ
jgi:hypothetical protein